MHIVFQCESMDEENMKRLSEDLNNVNLTIIVSETEKCSDLLGFKISEINLKPKDLSEYLFNKLTIKIHQNEKLLIMLVSYETFKIFDSLPKSIIQLESISTIDNKIKLHNCSEYFQREFFTENGEISIQDILSEDYILLTAQSGAGKTTETTQMYFRLRDKFPNHFIIYANLSDLKVKKDNYEVFTNNINNISDLSYFLFNKFLGFENFDTELLKYFMNNKQVIFMFDSLDEILPDFFDLVKIILNAVIELTECKIFLSSRNYKLEKTCKSINGWNMNMDKHEIQMCHEAGVFCIKLIEKFKKIQLKDLSGESCKYFLETVNARIDENVLKKMVEFSLKKDFRTPLLLKMLSQSSVFLSEDTSIAQIYRSFIGHLYARKNYTNYIDLNKDIKLYMKNAIESLFTEKTKNELIQNDLPRYFEYERMNVFKIFKVLDHEFIKDFFGVEYTNENVFQNYGVATLQQKDSFINMKIEGGSIKFNHSSYREYFISEFLIDSTGAKMKHYKKNIFEIFDVLHYQGRLLDLLEFLKCDTKIHNYFKDYEIIHQNLIVNDFQNDNEYLDISTVVEEFIQYLKNCENDIFPSHFVIYFKNETNSSVHFKDPFKFLREMENVTDSSCMINIYLLSKLQLSILNALSRMNKNQTTNKIKYFVHINAIKFFMESLTINESTCQQYHHNLIDISTAFRNIPFSPYESIVILFLELFKRIRQIPNSNVIGITLSTNFIPLLLINHRKHFEQYRHDEEILSTLNCNVFNTIAHLMNEIKITDELLKEMLELIFEKITKDFDKGFNYSIWLSLTFRHESAFKMFFEQFEKKFGSVWMKNFLTTKVHWNWIHREHASHLFSEICIGSKVAKIQFDFLESKMKEYFHDDSKEKIRSFIMDSDFYDDMKKSYSQVINTDYEEKENLLYKVEKLLEYIKEDEQDSFLCAIGVKRLDLHNN